MDTSIHRPSNPGLIMLALKDLHQLLALAGRKFPSNEFLVWSATENQKLSGVAKV
jgi:hypothetical protein